MQKTIEVEKVSQGVRKESAKQIINYLTGKAGIEINGNQPGDIKIYNENFYSRVLHGANLGLGESYMDHWWDCDHLDVLFDKLLSAHLDERIDIPWRFKLKVLLAKLINFQTISRAKEVAIKHYDLGNDLFKVMLDKNMIYSCAYWRNATTLDEAQIQKLDLICRKLDLKPGMRVLDIGSGWGGLAKYACEKYDVKVVAVTISKQQHEYAKENCAGLPIECRLQDYRDIHETFDRVVSVGMFEHVGHLNYDTFMKTVHRCLHDHGIFLLHTIGGNKTSLLADAWITKYIFPNGMLPSAHQIGKAIEPYFVMEDWQNLSVHYDKTLMAWHENFNKHWDGLKAKYGERFFRMWNYYLLCCAGGFRARSNQLWQIVLSKDGVRGGYNAIR